MLSLLSAVFCQYPRQRDSPVQTFTGPQDYEQPAYEDEDYDYRPQPNNQRPQPNDYRPQPNDQKPQPRNSVIYKPADVHYVNIGAELSGDYKFGYDTGKAENGQSFREETRLPDGSVQGAYGYTDEMGKQHIVKYTAGKDGFKVVGDEKKSSPSQPKRDYSQPQVHQSAQRQPQQAYQPSQQAPRAQAAYRPAPAPQRAYAPEPQRAYAPEPQGAYAPQRPSSYAPEPQSSYVPQPQTYAPKPQTYSSRGRSGSRYVPRPTSSYQDAEEDYDYPDNEVTERRLAPIDTSLLNYNIGTSSGGHA
ncbi:hypothetical protein JTE90_004515 [Oedothorax gibbosus]|uniref:Cuticle protein n=1 Tax=Oedothorax gibbosus TaxID=931172 RepID=A0AAV6VF67_9ARAC|nr:hypothetical protein JTE90_004515 [Oedothorax gibbosus]